MVVFATEAHAGFMVYCQGPLTAANGDKWHRVFAQFQWSQMGGAGTDLPKSLPGAGECAWPDRNARGNELKMSFISGFKAAGTVLQTGSYGKLCVTNSHEQLPPPLLTLIYFLSTTADFISVTPSDIPKTAQPC
jgi:hypothetical protein